MAQQNPDAERTGNRSRNQVNDLSGDIERAQRIIEDEVGNSSPEFARLFGKVAVQRGEMLDILLQVEQEARQLHTEFEQNTLTAAEVVERSETLSGDIAELREGAQQYHQRIAARDEYARSMGIGEANNGNDEFHSIQPGRYVTDRTDTGSGSPSRMLVLDRPGVCADKYGIRTGGPTVAEVSSNREYPADDPVVVVIYANDITDHFGSNYTVASLMEYYNDGSFENEGARTYAFPESRLKMAVDQTGPENFQ